MPTTKREPTPASEAELFARVFTDGKPGLTPALARHVLALGFSPEDTARMHELAVKNQEGRISEPELQELDSYIKVGDLLAILQSKARKSLEAGSVRAVLLCRVPRRTQTRATP